MMQGPAQDEDVAMVDDQHQAKEPTFEFRELSNAKATFGIQKGSILQAQTKAKMMTHSFQDKVST